MSFVRPEVAAGLGRWAEALVGAAGFAVGVGLLFRDERIALMFGMLLCIVGFGLIYTGVRRARQPEDGGGAGVVDVDERRVTYFLPEGGGSVSVDDIVRVQMEAKDRKILWYFKDLTGRELIIPSDAENAQALFDVLYALRGFDPSDALEVGALMQRGPFTAWEKEPGPLG